MSGGLASIRFAQKHNVSFVDADYDPDNWFARAKGMEWEPKRGARCTMCFDRTALYAHENGFNGRGVPRRRALRSRPGGPTSGLSRPRMAIAGTGGALD